MYQRTKKLATIGLLIAMEIVLSRFLSISTPIVRIGFGFVPIVVAAILYGPIAAGVAYALGDFLGAILFPIGAYFPGFTLTAFLAGVVFGALLHNRPANLGRALLAAVLVSGILHLGLDTLWLWMITGKGYLALLPPRILKCLAMVPVQTAGMLLLSGKRLRRLGVALQ